VALSGVWDFFGGGELFLFFGFFAVLGLELGLHLEPLHQAYFL
jgi:hypothetical protein